MQSKFRPRCIWSFALFFFPLTAAWGAGEQPLTVAKLQKVLGQYQAIARLDVDFKQTKTLKDINLELKSEGHLMMTAPDQVEWKITKPEPLTVNLDRQKVTIRSQDSTQSYSQEQNPSLKDRQSFATMLTWLKLDAAEIAAQYTVSEIALHRYSFLAKDDMAMIRTLEMALTSDGHVRELTLQEASGDQIRLQFQKPHVVYRK